MGIIWLMMVNKNLVGGWALTLWKMMEWKSVGMMAWPQYDGKHNPNVPNHQPITMIVMVRITNLVIMCYHGYLLNMVNLVDDVDVHLSEFTEHLNHEKQPFIRV